MKSPSIFSTVAVKCTQIDKLGSFVLEPHTEKGAAPHLAHALLGQNTPNPKLGFRIVHRTRLSFRSRRVHGLSNGPALPSETLSW